MTTAVRRGSLSTCWKMASACPMSREWDGPSRWRSQEKERKKRTKSNRSTLEGAVRGPIALGIAHRGSNAAMADLNTYAVLEAAAATDGK